MDVVQDEEMLKSISHPLGDALAGHRSSSASCFSLMQDHGPAHLVLLLRSLMLLSHSRPTGVHMVQYDRSMCAVWCDFNEHNIYVKYPTVVHWRRDAPPFKCYFVWTKSPTVSWDAVCRPCKHSMSSPLLQQVSQLVLQVFRVLHTGGQRNRTKLTAEKCSSCFSEAWTAVVTLTSSEWPPALDRDRQRDFTATSLSKANRFHTWKRRVLLTGTVNVWW